MIRKIVCLFIAMLTVSVHAQFSIDGREVGYDSLSHIILATVPERVYGTDLNARVQLDDNCTLLMINGQQITDSYTFHNVSPTHRYMTSLALSDGRILSGYIMFTCLPIVHLRGTFGYSYQEGQFLLCHPDSNKTETLTPQIKWRGATTNTPDRHKRNYKIKFPEDHSFFGLRNDNNWLLDAGQADVFRLRNLIANEIWGDFATPPYYADKKSKARTSIRGQVVEVFLNEEYRGIYAMTENIDRKQMKLKKFDAETGEIHGCLWKTIGYGLAVVFAGYYTPYNNISEMWENFEAKYPDLNDLDSIDWSILSNAIDFFANSTDEELINHYTEYVDEPVTIDYFIFQNVLSAVDNTGKNMFWAVYDKAADKKLTLAVWDLDCTVGQRWVEKYVKEASSPYFRIEYSINVMERLIYNLQYEDYTQKTINRYWQLRSTIFHVDSLCKRYQYYNDLLQRCGAANREISRWSGDSDIDGEIIDFNTETQYICNWIRQRLTFLDIFFRTLSGRLDIKEVCAISEKKQVYNLNGQQVSSARLKPGIYIIEGKKRIIK